jgi:hypothetical protein
VFLWSILSALHPVDRKDHPERVSKYRQCEHDFDDVFKGIPFPVEVKDISKFEKELDYRLMFLLMMMSLWFILCISQTMMWKIILTYLLRPKK